MSIMRAVREFLKSCPLLRFEEKDQFRLNVDFLDHRPLHYALESVPCDSLLTPYLGGGGRYQYLFVLASREPFQEDIQERLESLGFYEQFHDWLEQQNENGNLPDLGPGKTAVSLQGLTPGYLMDMDQTTARYQIQCRLEYYKM